ncbi:hypothetical protein I0P70_12530 [Pontibacter sp. FD36]|uniref:hypothetical protein n=1 Tax=Pontibacter sp. FD36 TaxID=2789860 RepID=UPI0018A9F43C|nr:hypothetical protein [Pontibacter sp. FD36]MBF8964074.1 hypothetical protein [Pontibacter sp. FD36]
MERELWYLLLEGKLGESVGALGDFYVFGDHLGNALFKASKYAGVVGISACHVVEAFPISRSGILHAPEATEQLACDVFIGRGLNTYFTAIREPGFIYPTGIIKCAADGVLALGTEEGHFTACGPDADGLYTLSLVLGERHLKKAFFLLSEQMEAMDEIQLAIRSYQHAAGKIEHWISAALKDKGSILEFIKKYTSDILENGFVKVSLQATTKHLRLTLDEHKTLKITAQCPSFLEALCRSIIFTGIKQVQVLTGLSQSGAHWHYRPQTAMDEASLKRLLKANGFQFMHREFR